MPSRNRLRGKRILKKKDAALPKKSRIPYIPFRSFARIRNFRPLPVTSYLVVRILCFFQLSRT